MGGRGAAGYVVRPPNTCPPGRRDSVAHAPDTKSPRTSRTTTRQDLVRAARNPLDDSAPSTKNEEPANWIGANADRRRLTRTITTGAVSLWRGPVRSLQIATMNGQFKRTAWTDNAPAGPTSLPRRSRPAGSINHRSVRPHLSSQQARFWRTRRSEPIPDGCGLVLSRRRSPVRIRLGVLTKALRTGPADRARAWRPPPPAGPRARDRSRCSEADPAPHNSPPPARAAWPARPRPRRPRARR